MTPSSSATQSYTIPRSNQVAPPPAVAAFCAFLLPVATPPNAINAVLPVVPPFATALHNRPASRRRLIAVLTRLPMLLLSDSMNLPLDLEDVLGAALVDALRRSALIVGVLAAGSLIAVLGLFAGEFVSDLIRFGSASLSQLDAGVFLVAIVPVLSPWGMIYLPLLLGTAFFCVKSESPDGRVLAGCAGAIGAIQIFTVAGVGELGWLTTVLALAVVAGCAGALGFLAVLIEHWRQRRAEEHFIGVAVENERRREEMERRNAGIVLDGPEAAE